MTNSTKPQSSDIVAKFHDTLAAALDEAPKSQKKDYDALRNEFEAWATKNGIVMDGLKCFRRDNMNCLTATREIQPDEVVLEVPRAAMITEEDAFESTLGKLLSQDQLVSSSPQLVLSLFVLYAKIAGDSKWEPYLALLPETFSTPFYFSQEALDILKGTLIYDEVQSRMKTILAQYDYVCNLLKPWMSTFFVNYPKGNDGLSFLDFLWALSITMTRQNPIPKSSGDGTMLALVPVWDFCNHMNGPIKTYYEAASDSLQHYAGKSFESGKEFTMSYGQRSNSELLIYSGFIDKENTNNYLNMILSLPPKDPLFEIKRNFLSNLNIPSTDQGIKLRLYQPLEHSQNEILFMVIKIMVMEESDLKQAIVSNEIETLKLSHTTKSQAEKISQWLKIKLQVILKLYPSSGEADQKMLKEDSNSADKLLAVQYRLLERDLISKLMHELQDRGISDAIKAF
ncbi:hypothetical protein MP638_004565 [Amoeboaphelidium occidentale]|nr:hypothetical protein MP638_004565 [Amoeboaphelidium occidentale]